jgi:hypothetical protein
VLCHTNPCPSLAFKHIIFHYGTRLANVVEVKSIMGGILTQIGNVENNDFNSIIYIKSNILNEPNIFKFKLEFNQVTFIQGPL